MVYAEKKKSINSVHVEKTVIDVSMNIAKTVSFERLTEKGRDKNSFG